MRSGRKVALKEETPFRRAVSEKQKGKKGISNIHVTKKESFPTSTFLMRARLKNVNCTVLKIFVK